jgi:hypothetical protein
MTPDLWNYQAIKVDRDESKNATIASFERVTRVDNEHVD